MTSAKVFWIFFDYDHSKLNERVEIIKTMTSMLVQLKKVIGKEPGQSLTKKWWEDMQKVEKKMAKEHKDKEQLSMGTIILQK